MVLPRDSRAQNHTVWTSPTKPLLFISAGSEKVGKLFKSPQGAFLDHLRTSPGE